MTKQNKPLGAALVVGGGIAGIQAALDLAEAGIKVYLVEEKPAIGGHMAQLDKTFPTNDCAMCILSPKLVEAGRHLNIELLTNTELMELRGEPGHFTAILKRKPRYIDPSKCTGCGDCAQVCPVETTNEYEEGLTTRKAAYKLYPQATPGAYAIEKRGIAPCRDACPAGQRAQGYIALIRERRYEEALRVIKEDNPFPSVCGRTCHHPCEGHCTRALVDEPVAIMALKRFVVDYAYIYGKRKPPKPVPRTRPQRVAIVGAGPCGLTAAQDLVKMGYGVTVFEALPVAGGLMRTAIPEHRLPKGILQRDIDDILALGVELKLNSPISDPTRLLKEGYDAVFLAVGVSGERRLNVEGEDLEGVLPAIAFLREVNLGQRKTIGRRVAVVGGGITAVDAATTSLRLGAEEVYMIYRRTREELPAYRWEIEEARREGVQLLEQTLVTRIIGQDGRVAAVECVKAKREPGKKGKSRLVPIPGTEFTLEVDTVIRALGQLSDLSFLAPPYDKLYGDLETLETEIPGIFAGSGIVPGTNFVVHAIALGHKAARSIDRYLRGEPLKGAEPPKPPVAKWSREEIKRLVEEGVIRPQKRVEPSLLPLEERKGSFQEVAQTLTEHQALAEAERCLQCGVCSECLECIYACQAGAVTLETHDEVEETLEIPVGAVVLALGYRAYDPTQAQEYGFGRYPNVVTSLQFERLLSASGPTQGHVLRPSDGKKAQRIAWLQCIGSRDQEHDYCSSVCCMYATKQAIMTKEHDPDAHCQVFLMDMRAFGKGYTAYYERAQRNYGIAYTRSRISAISEDPKTRDLILRYQAEDGNWHEERFDLVVLSVGLEIDPHAKELATKLGIELDEAGFVRTSPFAPLRTNREGVYVCGPLTEPKDIPETVIEASGAAALAEALLAPARGTMVQKKEYPPEVDVSGQEPRIGVFVCHCGSNIAGFLDVKAVTEYAKSLPYVVYAEDDLYTCSQDAQERIKEKIKEYKLNRVVVASCTPRTHEPLFQDTIRQAGLNPYLFEMANIRDQCSWVHSHDWDTATEKAKDLVRMAVARAALLEPLYRIELPIKRSALVIGGGIAGMTAALTLADQGFPVHLVERQGELGGNLRRIHYLLDGSDPQEFLENVIARVEAHPLITVYLNSEAVEATGFVGNFKVKIAKQGDDANSSTIDVGAIIVATGGEEYRPSEYLYGQHSRVLTQLELEERIAHDELPKVDTVVMIQCVGPADRYCSRICCTQAIKNALALKAMNPQMRVYVLYKDIRTYGLWERYYTKAREQGVLFLRYDDEHRPEVEPLDEKKLRVRVYEAALGRELDLESDLVVLSTGVVPSQGARELGSVFKVPVTEEGFFLEAHIKLRPVDFASDGIFLAGLAHWPKHVNEAIAQAQAAAARAATVLAEEVLLVGGEVAVVDAEKCTGCLTCVRACPYQVPRIMPTLTGTGGIKGAAYIEPAQCHGCGTCAAECPAKAIQLMHYKDEQIDAKIEALFAA